jgi:uncharacterized membrane protein YgdD (TMEM256/DUF423 family)
MITVAMGAFGAHMLKDRLDPEMLEVWRTGVLYQGLHALALVLCGVLHLVRRSLGAAPSSGAAGWAFLAGTLLFSGSLYGLALGGPSWLGPITPIGGTAFIVGWLLLAWQGLPQSSTQR